ncbi:putative sugar nucleotidyl transferase [Sediminibacterium soli]|uniref:putative sugar nucleotidyl transferase n=1 Tax=Sediminibacterium soli TaxID=2698829 RepID=UPI0013797B00|nr:putative sugar nucleotidyl transferase [Sediminibacterium soli]NCI46206.1 glucose-1-phosphate thymidylyltransferase [Sediminibacterium soli]
MAIVLFDNAKRKRLYPFTLTRAVAGIRFGIYTIAERWERLSGGQVFIHTEEYLQTQYAAPAAGEHTWIDASVIVTETLLETIRSLEAGQGIADDNGIIAGKGSIDAGLFDPADGQTFFTEISHVIGIKRLEYPWQLMQWNDDMIRFDHALVSAGRVSQTIPDTVNTIAPGDIFIEPGARLNFCTINASTGPVYIGKNAEIMEGASIRGPFSLGENSVVKMNSRIYGATTLGPNCLGGGEIKNSVVMGNSNKAHDGYLGDAVVGEWCNFGAGSTNSNIKNTAGQVKVWSISEQAFIGAGQKCGAIVGDYSRIAINAAINTGSMIGICSNVFGEGLLPVCIHHFSWGVKGNTYTLEKALQDIDNWKKLKEQQLGDEEENMLRYIFANL